MKPTKPKKYSPKKKKKKTSKGKKKALLSSKKSSPKVHISNGERVKIESLLFSEDLTDKEKAIGLIVHYREKGIALGDIYTVPSEAKRIQRAVTRARKKIRLSAVKNSNF